MPPPSGTKKKKGRAPKHQNSFAFRHNPNSKKTDKILSSPNAGVCRRCHEKIEWRKKYRKYKPRTQPGKCNLCFKKNVLAAYHTICTKCTTSDKAISAMEEKRQVGSEGGPSPASTSATASASEHESASGSSCIVDGEIAGEGGPPSCSSGDRLAAETIGNTKSKRHIRVCAMCTNEPALSKHANASGEEEDIMEQIHELEETLKSGVHKNDGHKLTLREVKGVERKLEKFQLELKQRQKKKKADEKEVGGEEGGETDEQTGESEEEEDAIDVGEAEEDSDDEEDDPFLLATDGRALVGEEYQKMLLAREESK
ncbi:hypothetical protein ACHAWF_003497 [Thalassiosira exigua]